MSGPGHRPVPSDGMACLVIHKIPPLAACNPAPMTHGTALHVLIPHPRQKSLHAILPLQWHAGSLHFLQKVTCFDNVLCSSSHLQNAELIRPAILAAMGAASICLVQCLRPIGPSPYHVAAVKIIWSVLQDERAASEAVSFLSGAGLLFLRVGYLFGMP